MVARTRWRGRAVAVALVAGLAGASCRSPASDLAEPKTALLVSSDALGPPFLARQKVVVRRGESTESFEAAVQVHGGKLVLVAMTPMGIKLFTVVQQGQAVQATTSAGLQLPFSPEHVLVDVHRAYFAAIPSAPRADGVHALRVADETLEETWAAGRLERRAFFPGGGGKPTVTVDYGRGLAPGQAWPPTTVLTDLRRGYTLEILTTGWDPLPAGAQD